MDQIDNPLTALQLCSKAMEGGYGAAMQAIGILFFVLIFTFISKVILGRLRDRFLKQKNPWALSFVSSLYKPLTYFVWFVAGLCTLDLLLERCFEGPPFNLHMLISIGAVAALGWFLLRWNRKIVHNMMEMSHENKISLSLGQLDLLSKLATIFIIIFIIFLMMDVTGRDMQTLIAFGGISGLALAFASQQVISNFFGGIMVYFTQPFSIGEQINLPEKKIEGHIEEIGWYMTCVRNLDKRPVYVPNSVFTQTVVINPSRKSHERFLPQVNLTYASLPAIPQIVTSIRALLLAHSAIDHHLKTDVYFTGFGASSVNIFVSAYIQAGTQDLQTARQNLLIKIAAIVKDNGAEFAVVEAPSL
ncbi:MAG: mechanosensitive ion channel family protein [Parachlamydia sp.]|jgi:MscS family membrane protein|nr:mechanosensitive ion channel family protein [Parachlamydia sp.]